MRIDGKSYNDIGKELGVTGEAVRKRLLAAADRGDLYPRSPPGRAPLTPRTVRHIHRSVVSSPYSTYKAIAQEHGVGPKMVAKVAAAHFIYRFVSKAKPFLSPKSRGRRLEWVPIALETGWMRLSGRMRAWLG